MSLLKKVWKKDILYRIYTRLRIQWMPTILAFSVTVRFLSRKAQKPHGLTGPLIVSLTSFPPRFKQLPLTLKCLLSQTVKPDSIILWIAKNDQQFLTEEILELEGAGLQIRFCDDYRSYKKIIPVLEAFQDAFVVTADDDLFYWSTWLEELVDAHKMSPEDIVCHLAHRIRLSPDGSPLPYLQWELNSTESETSALTFPTTGAGALYPPRSFDGKVGDVALFTLLCPNADDIWLYWMMRLVGRAARRIPRPKRNYYCWEGSQGVALWHDNLNSAGNDRQMKKMIDTFGFCTFDDAFNSGR
ncbi:hypothetical protein L4X63_18605 [Geomonas sp. Red32]|uniref:hypothetical protein n=1 Tax=Geomonas sp. Red32 TaxID=2912856 RepID=UPI00202CC7F2|nr:hypothetical protein [Geomonas sp. Red32]MCM0083601.1 hypothetical protein [Geomonas sp. Red32]